MNVSYLINFIVYALAMSGVLIIGVVMYKKFFGCTTLKSEKKFLSVKDVLTIAPRKNLYVVQAGEEYFLVAGDAERTTMLSKLNIGQYKQEQISKDIYQNEDILANKKIMQRLNERFKN